MDLAGDLEMARKPNNQKMKTLIIAAALGLGSLLTTSVSAQTPAPAKQSTAHKTATTVVKATATH